jgi:hypothetical protein
MKNKPSCPGAQIIAVSYLIECARLSEKDAYFGLAE